MALLIVTPATQAQRVEATLDVGGAALRYADTLSTGAASITPRLTADWGSGFVDMSGTYSQFTSGGWSTQGSVSASRFIPAAKGFLGELGGFAGGSTHSDGTRTGEAIANGRLHFVRAPGEVFVGFGGGGTWDLLGWRRLLLGEAGASIGWGQSDAMFTISPTMVNDSIRYTDSQASLSWKGARAELGALLGFRMGDQLTTLNTNVKSWASASAALWIAPQVAIAAGGGNYPVDPTQGFPGGRFVSLSLRISQRRHSDVLSTPFDQPSIPSALPAKPAPAVAEFIVSKGAGDAVTLRINAPGARLVEINGDFTTWTPLTLTSAAEGWWSVTLPIAPGQYQMNVRVNGGPWTVPPGLLSITDEFGGAVGLLVVE